MVVGLKEEEEGEVEEDDLLLRVDGASFRVGAVGADGSSSSSSNSSSSDNKSSSNNNDGTSDQGSDAERGSSFTVRGVGLAVGPGELVAVASTYFRRAGAVSYNLTDVQSEVLLVDHGLPSPDAVLGGVAFAQIRGVMEAAAEAINQLVEHTPIAIRTDVAVDRYPS